MKLSASSGPDPGTDKGQAAKPDYGLCQGEVEGDALNCGELQHNGYDAEIEEGQLIPESVKDEKAAISSTGLPVSTDLTEAMMVLEDKSCSSEPASNGCLSIQNEIGIVTHPIGENSSQANTGVKRSRTEGLQSSVHIKYCDLPRDSKRKLQELLQQWSKWHERYCSSSYEMAAVLESGEQTYFPALNVGLDNKSAVSFWMDDQVKKPEDNSLMSVDNDSVPLYDRGFSLGLASVDGTGNLEGGLEVADASRCFNCGSYSHALKECPKPRDNAAVNNARKQLKSKRNQSAGSRNAARYYQSSAGGKYEGLKPGVLDPETRRLLGLGELEPPPWLHRMREIGYPPGYLEPEESDQPSGITIFADEESRKEGDHEDGEILETDHAEPRKKMSVEFPGINVPIPEKADKRRWDAGVSKFDPFRDPLQDREDDKSDYFGRRRFQETRSARDLKNESSSYPPRYGSQEAGYVSSSKNTARRPKSPNFGWSPTDRERERQRDRDRDSRSSREDSPSFGLYSSFSYPSPSRRPSNQSFDFDDGRHALAADYPSRGRDKEDKHRHHSRR